MTEILNSGCLHSNGDSSLTYLLKYEFENVLAVFQAQTIAQYLSKEDFWHITKNHFVFAHQGFEKDLVYLVVGRPIIANDVVSYRFDKLLMQVIVRAFVLDVGVGVTNESFSVVNLHVCVVGAQHVQSKQVDNCLFPGHWGGLLKVLYCFCAVVLDAVHGYFVRHIALSGYVGHWIHLKEYEVGHVLGNNIDEKVQVDSFIRHNRHGEE